MNQQDKKIHKICVFAGAQQSSDLQHMEIARKLGQIIASKKLNLIYGGANCGLMNELANATITSGGHVIGIIPKILHKQEIAHPNLAQLYIVDSMSARKQMMTEMADAFIALPGGLGTLEEIFEVWNSLKIGLYQKPFGILNINNYFDYLLKFLDHTIQKEFITRNHSELAIIDKNPHSLIDKIILLLANTEKIK